LSDSSKSSAAALAVQVTVVSNMALAACRRQLLPLRLLAPSALLLTTAERTGLLRAYR